MGRTGAYSFSSNPRAVKEQRTKYRSTSRAETEELPSDLGNIMYDPRVVRGSTVISKAASKERQRRAKEMARIQRQRERQRETLRARQIESERRSVTPPPVSGRIHMDVQTDSYLEELTDRPPETDTYTQTDPLMDRPPSPLFIPVKTGVDKETQIEEGDLFDFDMEVAPILEVLVGKTLEQSMDEVLEEEEIANIRAQRAEFEQMRNIELAEVQRLESEAKRRIEEKERRLAQEKDRIAREEQVMQKIASRGFARKFFENVHRSVFARLVEDGHFYDPVARDIETSFLPWIQERAAERVERTKVATALCDDLIRSAMKKIPSKIETSEEEYRRALEMAEAKDKEDQDDVNADAEDENANDA